MPKIPETILNIYNWIKNNLVFFFFAINRTERKKMWRLFFSTQYRNLFVHKYLDAEKTRQFYNIKSTACLFSHDLCNSFYVKRWYLSTDFIFKTVNVFTNFLFSFSPLKKWKRGSNSQFRMYFLQSNIFTLSPVTPTSPR